MSGLAGKTVLISGGSRGIGKAIALRAARDGANIVIAAKTIEPHPKLPGTIFTAAEEIEAAGGTALACRMDVRNESEIKACVKQAVETFGGIDIVVNNASAIRLTTTGKTPLKIFDLMHQINVRGTFALSQACLPHLRGRPNPHILTMCPPLNLAPGWLGGHVAYTLSKYGMSLLVLGLAEELRADGIASNGLWPRTTIATAAIRNLLGGEAAVRRSRKPEIVADAAHAVFTRSSRECTGNLFLDEDVLREAGVEDFEAYAVEPGADLIPDLFLGEPGG
jgi:citronellol/citronellal dehydrogenase